MPQLDVATYPSQLFWLGICFVVLYFLLSTFLIPKVVRILDNREKVREDKLNMASLYREEAEGLLIAYEKAIDQARKDALQNYQAHAHETLEKLAGQKKEMLERLQKRLHEAELDLYRARREASSDMHIVAQDIAGELLQKLTGETYPAHQLVLPKEKK